MADMRTAEETDLSAAVFRSKMAAAPTAETVHLELKQLEFYRVWCNYVQTLDSCL